MTKGRKNWSLFDMRTVVEIALFHGLMKNHLAEKARALLFSVAEKDISIKQAQTGRALNGMTKIWKTRAIIGERRKPPLWPLGYAIFTKVIFGPVD